MQLIHHSPMGALQIPEVGVVDAGEPFDAPDDIAASLLEQSDLYSPAPPIGYAAQTVPQLLALAAERGIDLGKKPKKDDLVAALEAADAASTEGDQQ